MFQTALGQLPLRKIAPNPITNTKRSPNPNTNRGAFSSGQSSGYRFKPSRHEVKTWSYLELITSTKGALVKKFQTIEIGLLPTLYSKNKCIQIDAEFI